MTKAEYLEFEENTDVRHEFENGILYAMAGDKRVNNRIAGNLYKILDDVALERGCRAYVADTKVVTQKGSFFYPDVMVSCAPPSADPLTESNPCVLFEILSPSTETRDRGVKLRAYTFDIPALEQYILVSSEERLVEMYQKAAGGIWSYHVYRDESDVVPIRCLETTLTLEQMYRYVEREYVERETPES